MSNYRPYDLRLSIPQKDDHDFDAVFTEAGAFSFRAASCSSSVSTCSGGI